MSTHKTQLMPEYQKGWVDRFWPSEGQQKPKKSVIIETNISYAMKVNFDEIREKTSIKN